jgi:hypothetical protein
MRGCRAKAGVQVQRRSGSRPSPGCSGRRSPAPRTGRRKRSARPATGTRGWTTLRLSFVTRKRPDLVKSRGVPVLPALGRRWLPALTASRPGRNRLPAFAGEPPGRLTLGPALRLTRAHTFPDDHFAPTVGFAGLRPSAIPAAPPTGQESDSASVYVPHMFRPVKPDPTRAERSDRPFARPAIMACPGGADVAEPVDAGDLKSPAPRGVRVRVPPSAPGRVGRAAGAYGPPPIFPVSGSTTKGIQWPPG